MKFLLIIQLSLVSSISIYEKIPYYKKSQGFLIDSFDSIRDALANKIKNVSEFIVDKAEEVYDYVGDKAEKVYDYVGDKAEEVYEYVGDKISDIKSPEKNIGFKFIGLYDPELHPFTYDMKNTIIAKVFIGEKPTLKIKVGLINKNIIPIPIVGIKAKFSLQNIALGEINFRDYLTLESQSTTVATFTIKSDLEPSSLEIIESVLDKICLKDNSKIKIDYKVEASIIGLELVKIIKIDKVFEFDCPEE